MEAAYGRQVRPRLVDRQPKHRGDLRVRHSRRAAEGTQSGRDLARRRRVAKQRGVGRCGPPVLGAEPGLVSGHRRAGHSDRDATEVIQRRHGHEVDAVGKGGWRRREAESLGSIAPTAEPVTPGAVLLVDLGAPGKGRDRRGHLVEVNVETLGQSGGQVVGGRGDGVGIGGAPHRNDETVNRADRALRGVRGQALRGASRLRQEKQALLDLRRSDDPPALHPHPILLGSKLDGGRNALDHRREFRLGDGRLPSLLQRSKKE